MKQFQHRDNIILKLSTYGWSGIQSLTSSFLTETDLFSFTKSHPLVYEHYRHNPFLLERIVDFQNFKNLVNKVFKVQRLRFSVNLAPILIYAKNQYHWLFSNVHTIETNIKNSLKILKLSQNEAIKHLTTSDSLEFEPLLPLNLIVLSNTHCYEPFSNPTLNFNHLTKLTTLILPRSTDIQLNENSLPLSLTELNWPYPSHNILPNVLPKTLKRLIVEWTFIMTEENIPTSIEILEFRGGYVNGINVFPNGITCFPKLKRIYYQPLFPVNDGTCVSNAISDYYMFMERNSQTWWLSKHFPNITKTINTIHTCYTVVKSCGIPLFLIYLLRIPLRMDLVIGLYYFLFGFFIFLLYFLIFHYWILFHHFLIVIVLFLIVDYYVEARFSQYQTSCIELASLDSS